MTKEEIKALVASKIEGQGNQVDLGSALAAILGEILDRVPERAPITIDLSGFELSTDTDVTSAIPSGYVPQTGDEILYSQIEYGMESIVKKSGGFIAATFGYGNSIVEEASIIRLIGNDNGTWIAQQFEL